MIKSIVKSGLLAKHPARSFFFLPSTVYSGPHGPDIRYMLRVSFK